MMATLLKEQLPTIAPPAGQTTNGESALGLSGVTQMTHDPETDLAEALRHPAQEPVLRSGGRPRVQLERVLRAARLKAAQQRKQANQIAEQIEARVVGGIQELSVSYEEDQHFVLRGRCGSYHLKQLAQHIAMNLVGASQVANAIEVSRPR